MRANVHRYLAISVNAVAVTIVSRRYFALAKVTAGSFAQHNPHIPFKTLIIDELEPLENEIAGSVIRLSDLAVPHIVNMCFRYTELELCFSLTPYVISYLFEQGYSKVLFLKQETFVLGDITPIFTRLSAASAVVTPHFLEPPTRADAVTWEVNVLRSGVINGGVIGFSRTQESSAFLLWWQDRMASECLLDVDNGLHYEQRWLDFLPVFIPGFHVISDPGINVGHWNIADRVVRRRPGGYEVDGHQLRIFRFSGFDYENPSKLTRYDSRDVAEIGEGSFIIDEYIESLHRADHSEYMKKTYAYDRFHNGKPISLRDRLAYRRLGGEAARFGNPFETRSRQSFYWWNKLPRSIFMHAFRYMKGFIKNLMP